MLKTKLFIIPAVIVLTLIFAMLHYSSAVDQSKLTAKTWHSKMKYMLPSQYYDKGSLGLDDLYTTSVVSDFKYLKDNSYIQNSYIEAYNEDNNLIFTIELSSVGKWKYDEGYLFLEVGDIQDVSSVSENYIAHENVGRLKELFLIDMLQVRKIDIIDENTMLMTSVDNASKLWISN